jgi:hypothetical protein
MARAGAAGWKQAVVGTTPTWRGRLAGHYRELVGIDGPEQVGHQTHTVCLQTPGIGRFCYQYQTVVFLNA